MYPRILFQYLKSQPCILLQDGSYSLAILPLCLCSMEKKNVVNDSFPNELYVSALVDDISLNFRHKD